MDTIGRSRWYWEASAEIFRSTESTAILGSWFFIILST
jgi:hypothetical protein